MDPIYTAMLERIKEKGRGNIIPFKKDEVLDGIECSRCRGEGFVEMREANGHVYMAPCPACYSKRMVVRHLRASGISPEDYYRYNLQNFDGSRSAEAAKMLSMAARYLDHYDKDGPGFGVFGMSGMGKTHLCIGICQEITKRFGEAHYYFSYRAEMPNLIKAARSYSGDYEAAMEKWKTVPNLYIDDLFKLGGEVKEGRLIRLDSDDARVVFDLVNARYVNHLKTFFSSEYALNNITILDSALGSRIVEMIKPYGIYVEGKNQRLVM